MVKTTGTIPETVTEMVAGTITETGTSAVSAYSSYNANNITVTVPIQNNYPGHFNAVVGSYTVSTYTTVFVSWITVTVTVKIQTQQWTIIDSCHLHNCLCQLHQCHLSSTNFVCCACTTSKIAGVC